MCTRSGTIVKQTGQHIVVFAMKCKSWTCPECSKLRRWALIREAKMGHPNKFITLTVNPFWFDDEKDRASELAKAWRLIVAAYRHKWPNRECEYLAVFEATQRGEPHLHIMFRGGWVDQKWLSAQMRARMGAPVVDVRVVKGPQQVSEYVTKYISKRNVRFGTCKRYWRSKKYLAKSPRQLRREKNAGSIFYRSQKHITDYFAACIRVASVVHVPREGMFEFDLPLARSHPPWFFQPEGDLVQV